MKALDSFPRSTPEEDFRPIVAKGKKKGQVVTRSKAKQEKAAGGRAGRPKGVRSSKDKVVRFSAPRCPACGSSARGHYIGTTSRESIEGVFEGEPFNLITTRRTRCRCGQARLEKEYEKI